MTKMTKYLALLPYLILTLTHIHASDPIDRQPNELSSSSVLDGLRIAAIIYRQVINGNVQDVEVMDGVHIVETETNELTPRTGRKMDGAKVEVSGTFDTVGRYLTNHEIRIDLQRFFPKENVRGVVRDLISGISDRDVESGRGKKNKGGGMIMAMGLMMGKVLSAVAFSAIGALAMKALGVSALALMLAAIIGVKKLASSGHEESGHQVIYAGHGHEGHRRRRDTPLMTREHLNRPLPYRGWIPS